MRITLSEEYKQKLIYDLEDIWGIASPSKVFNKDGYRGYRDLLEETKKFVYGYAKTVAKEEIAKREFIKKTELPTNKWKVDWTYKPYNPTYTFSTQIPSTIITVGGSTTSSTWASIGTINTTATCNNTDNIVFTNIDGQTYMCNVSSVSNRISNKIKEIINNVNTK